MERAFKEVSGRITELGAPGLEVRLAEQAGGGNG